MSDFLEQYQALTGLTEGLPRGIGISAKLAESYLGQVDGRLAAAPGVVLSARYVDDIVVVGGAPKPRSAAAVDYLALISKYLGDLGLNTNPLKTMTIDASTNGDFAKWEFLGYQYHRSGSTEISLTGRRVNELQRRIDLTFDAWSRSDQLNTGVQGLFLNRIRFLTGNTRLTNNKRNALVGIYFSNRHLTRKAQLEHLDGILASRLASAAIPPSLVERLKACSFVSGFQKRPVHNFTTRQLRDICGLWRNG